MDNLTPFILAYIYQPTNPPAYKPTLSYASYVYDTETERYYLQARYYDQDTASFISRDPDGGTMDNPLNQNAYANADPVKNVDPDGKFAFAPWVLAGLFNATFNVVLTGIMYYLDVKMKTGIFIYFTCYSGSLPSTIIIYRSGHRCSLLVQQIDRRLMPLNERDIPKNI